MELDPRNNAGEYQQNQLKPYRISMNFIETWRDVHGEREKGLPAAAQTLSLLIRGWCMADRSEGERNGF